MRLTPKTAGFLAFTAAFAVLAGFVFWGTWGLAVAPVMPDHPVSYPLNYVETWVRGWLTTGKFVPGDVIVFLGSPYFWLELKYALALYCAGLGMAYFLRGRGISYWSSYSAGLLLAFSGYWCTLFSAGHFGWFQWMTYGVFAFGLIDRALAGGRYHHWLFLGAVLAWGSFYQPDLWLLFTLFSAIYFVFRAIALKAFRVQVVKGGACALLTFLLIGLPSFHSAIFKDLAGRDAQIAAGQTVGSATTDAADKRWEFVTNWSMPPEETLEFYRARRQGDTSCPYTLAIGTQNKTGIKAYTGRLGRPLNAAAGNYRQHSLYIGETTLLAVFVALVFGCRKRNSTVIFFGCAAVAFWFISLGRYCEPIYRVIYALPMGDYLRAPVKWHHLTEFCLVVLAGYGLDSLMHELRRCGRFSPRVIYAFIGLLLFSALLNLSTEAHRFCAPRKADADLQFADARLVQTPHAQMQLRMQGIRVIGSLPQQGAALLEIPKPRAKQALPPYQADAFILTVGILSALTTLFVLAFGGFSFIRPRIREIRGQNVSE